MKFLAIASFGLCLISSALAAPVADDSSTSYNEARALLDKRELIATIHNKPTKDSVCNGKELSLDAILEALSQGVRWHAAGIQNGALPLYPHFQPIENSYPGPFLSRSQSHQSSKSQD